MSRARSPLGDTLAQRHESLARRGATRRIPAGLSWRLSSKPEHGLTVVMERRTGILLFSFVQHDVLQ